MHAHPSTLALSDAETLVKVTRARDRALALYPWFGALAMNLRIKADTRISTMATDGTHAFYNPAGCAPLSEPNLIFIWAHEVMHCGLLHMYRKPAWLDWHEWNVCTDLAINGELIRLAVGAAPTGILRDAQYDSLSAEQIAHARRKARQQAQAEQAERERAQAEQAAQDAADDGDSDEDEDGDDDDSDQDDAQGQDESYAAGDEDEPQDDGASDDSTGAPDGDGSKSEAGQPGDQDAGADDDAGDGAGDAGEQDEDVGEDAADDGAPGNGGGQADAPVDAFNPDGTLEPGDDCLPPSAEQAGDDDGGQGQAPEPRTEADWQLAVDQTTSAMRKAGEMPGSLVTMVNATRRTRTDWREVTRAFIEQVSPSDFTWRRANRRYASQGLYLPGTDRANLPPMMVIVDSSGSCGQDECDTFASALTDILSECKPRAIYVVYCDTQVNGEMTTFTPDADSEVTLTPMGGGGTYFQPAFDWVAEAMQDGTISDPPACILYLTDGYAADLNRLTEPDLPVLFAIVPGGTTAMPFGEVIEMELE